MVKKPHSTFSKNRCYISKFNMKNKYVLCSFEYSTWLEKRDSTFSNNWCYNSKHNMVKNKFYLQLNNIF